MISALTIAGSDPSGGAGVQADLRVFASLGIAGWSAVTALTVQNTQGVQAVHPVSADVLAAQIQTVLSDAADLRAVKIGMLGGAAQVRVVADALRRFRPPNVVLDPILASTGGVPLLDDAGRAALLEELLPLCDLVTPNLAEAGALTGLTVNDVTGMRAAGERLLALGAKAVLVKGGHLHGAPNDLLFRPGRDSVEYAGGRVETPHTHGTGCLLSSLIAAGLAHGDELRLALTGAKATLSQALRAPILAGKGFGYPDVADAIRVLKSVSSRTHAERLALLRGLYVLTDPDLRPDRSAEYVAGEALAGGAAVIQLRDKHLPTPALIALARRLNERARSAGALFFINDRVDVALASGADGVHLGPDDMHPKDARNLLGPDKLIGVSVSSVEEAVPLAPFASYFGVGAIFGSATKTDAGPPVGVARIRAIKAAFPNHPIVAIGGINVDNIAEVTRAGADAAAVVSAVVAAPDVRQAARDLICRLRPDS